LGRWGERIKFGTKKKVADLFAGDIVGGELDLAHTTSAEGLAEGIVAEHPAGARALLLLL
jgi:hypothetical protein